MRDCPVTDMNDSTISAIVIPQENMSEGGPLGRRGGEEGGEGERRGEGRVCRKLKQNRASYGRGSKITRAYRELPFRASGAV